MKYFYLANNVENYISKHCEISNNILIEKKSKFISFIFEISNNDMALEYISKISNYYNDARHIVYIYSYLENNVLKIRFSDDGEPQGTGTKAIYDMLIKENITNICIIIVRYFGGILLGAGPLSRTYLTSAKEAIGKCSKYVLYNYINKKINIKYSKYELFLKKLEEYLNENTLIISSVIFNEVVNISLKIADIKEMEIKNKLQEFIV